MGERAEIALEWIFNIAKEGRGKPGSHARQGLGMKPGPDMEALRGAASGSARADPVTLPAIQIIRSEPYEAPADSPIYHLAIPLG